MCSKNINKLYLSCPTPMVKQGKLFCSTPWSHIGRKEIISLLIPSLDTKWRWVVKFTSRPLYPRQSTPISTEREAGWDTKTVCTFWRRYKFLSPAGIKTPDRQARSLGSMSTTPGPPDDSRGTNHFQYQLT